MKNKSFLFYFTIVVLLLVGAPNSYKSLFILMDYINKNVYWGVFYYGGFLLSNMLMVISSIGLIRSWTIARYFGIASVFIFIVNFIINTILKNSKDFNSGIMVFRNLIYNNISTLHVFIVLIVIFFYLLLSKELK